MNRDFGTTVKCVALQKHFGGNWQPTRKKNITWTI